MAGRFTTEELQQLLKEGLDLSDDLKNDIPQQFQVGYQDWYSRTLHAIRELLPERLQEFERHYDYGPRASLQVDTYCIQDFLLGLTIIRGNKPFDGKGITRSRILQQIMILGSAKPRLEAGKDTVGFDPRAQGRAGNASRPDDTSKGRRVFVIHGRDERLRKGMFDFLRAIGLDPLEWSQALALSGKAAPYIGDILDAAFSHAQAVVVLLTPDDEVRLRSDLIRPDDPPDERRLRGQARPNVLFEAGMAFATHSTATVLVRIGDIKPFSDVGGRHVVNMDNSIARRQELGQKLKTAGCSVNLDGTDWHNAGDLTQPITQADQSGTKETQSRPLIKGDILEAYADTNYQTTIYDFETVVALRVRLVNESVRSSILDYELTVEGNKAESSNLRAGDLSYWRLAKEEKASPKGTRWVKQGLVSLDAEIGNGVLETGIKKEGWLVFLMKNLEPEDIKDAEIILVVEDAYKQKHRIARNGLSTDGRFVETAWGG